MPYHPRPSHYSEDDGNFWHDWLADDQREASTRTDVLTLATPPLAQAVHIAGEPVADLLASTTGSDGDFVVKLIDVYPDEVPVRPAMSGYQLMISADIMRGRYREDLSKPHAITPGQAVRYRFSLPTANHVVPARTPHHGAGAVDLVSAGGPQSANLRGQHLSWPNRETSKRRPSA